MDSLQEVSSTMTEDSDVLDGEVSAPHNGISLAEAASALITLQIPSKEPGPAPVSSSKNGEGEKPTEGAASEVNPKDFRKRILEGMKSQFNTNTEEDTTCEVSNRRGPNRSQSKSKRQGKAEPSEVVTVKVEVQKTPARGRGRPPRLVPLEVNSSKIEESPKNERDSSSEAGSERGDSVTGAAVTTRRSQRTNVSRTSATDLLKGLSENHRPLRKAPSEPEMAKPAEVPRKRGRPAKQAPTSAVAVKEEETASPKVVEEDPSKVEHMASLGLQSKSSPEPNSLANGAKKRRANGSIVPERAEEEEMELSSPSESGASTIVTGTLENEVELSIVDGSSAANHLVNGTAKMSDVFGGYACSCVEGCPPVATAPPAATLYCQAVDSVGGKLVGCCLVASRKRFYRPSRKIHFMILCESHRDRIRKHFCCPGCGLFCTQGTFLQCRSIEGSIHFFHADCQHSGQKSCLHCQRNDDIGEIRLQMKTCAVPVFCNDAKLLKTIPTAKISRMPVRGNAEERSDPACPQFISSKLVLPSGKVIDASGLPGSLGKDVLERIIKAFDHTGKGPAGAKNLYVAAKNGEIERTVECLRAGHNVNKIYQDADGQTPLHAAAFAGHLAIVHIMLQSGAFVDRLDSSQNTPLALAVVQGHNDLVKYLIQIGASTCLKGEGGMTPLHLACKYGNLEACHYIVTLGNGNKFINAKDDGGWTPLVWGCEHQRLHIVKYLLQCKADPLVRDAEKNVALHWAAFSGSVDILALLLDQGCQVNAANLHGDTPLHTAARRDNYECVLLLITRGGRLDLRNKEKHLALEVCPDKQCHSALLIALNMKLQQFTQAPCSDAENVLTNDVTKGKETNPIQCVNGFDDEEPPQDYVYITDNCFTSPLHIDRTINSLMSCKCSDDCSVNCKCCNLSFRCWYDPEGRLAPEFNYNDPPMLFECNRACDCHRSFCTNRVVQHGIKARLVLFRVENKGWGVRALQAIPKGSYVCEYVGEIITDFEADQREDDSYLFDLDNKDGETYCIDARRYGNIARFINHSCEPNLVPVKVYIDHQDLKFPRIAFFAARDIGANEELAFDYGDKFWIIKYKSFTCSCLSAKCKYSQQTINQTIEEYHRSLQLQELEDQLQETA